MKLPLDWGQNHWVQTCLFDDESLMSGTGPSPIKCHNDIFRLQWAVKNILLSTYRVL